MVTDGFEHATGRCYRSAVENLQNEADLNINVVYNSKTPTTNVMPLEKKVLRI